MSISSPRRDPFSTTHFGPLSARATDELLNLPPAFIAQMRKEISSKKNDLIQGDILPFEYVIESLNDNNDDDSVQTTLKVKVIVPPFGKKERMKAFLILDDEVLGEGGDGKVVKSIDLFDFDRTLVACKIGIHSAAESHSKDELASSQVVLERDNLKLIENRLQAQFSHQIGHLIHNYTFMNYYPGESLLAHLYEINKDASEFECKYQRKKHFDFPHKLTLCIAIIEEVLLVHEFGLIYRDLKTDNFLVSDIANLFKLVGIDFGSAVKASNTSSSKSLTGTTNGYVDPELDVPLKERSHFTKQHDYYSLGVVLCEILTDENLQQHLFDAIKNSKHGNLIKGDQLKKMMPDIFHNGNLAQHRNMTNVPSFAITSSNAKSNNDDDCPPAEKVRKNTLVPSDKLEDKIHFILLDLIYKLLSISKPPHSINPVKSGAHIKSTAECIEHRPSEAELRHYLTLLKLLRMKLSIENERREINQADNATVSEAAMKSKLAAYREKRRVRATTSKKSYIATTHTSGEKPLLESSASCESLTYSSTSSTADALTLPVSKSVSTVNDGILLSATKQSTIVDSAGNASHQQLNLITELDALLAQLMLDEPLKPSERVRVLTVQHQLHAAKGAQTREITMDCLKEAQDLLEGIAPFQNVSARVKALRKP